MIPLAQACLLAILGVLPFQGSDVRVTTRDGEVIDGTVSVSRWQVRVDRRTNRIDSDEIASIELGDPDVIRKRDGEEVRGELRLSSLRVKLEKGSRSLKRDEIATIELVSAGGGEAGGFTGRWSGSFGPMRLEQKGDRVQGTYGFDDEFTLEGSVKGNRLEFTYREPNVTGKGWFEMWEDSDTFAGEFQADGQSRSQTWSAYRIQHRLAKPVPGEMTEGQSTSYLNYHLRVPKGFDGRRTYPAIAFFHGSNMSSRGYVATIARNWPKLAEDYILIGFDGERLSSAARPDARAYNATYVNFSGHEKWHKWAYRQTPALAAEALDELREALPIEHYFIGGHSQGGFLTFAIAMFYPEKIAGAFPMSGNLLVQCEPDNFEDGKERAAQRRIPIAIVHGQRDTVVDFSSAQYCYERFQDGGFPMLQLFAPKNVAHVFDHLPVEDAVRWLEKMSATDPEELVSFAQERERAGEYRDALAALQRARDAGAEGGVKRALDGMEEDIDEKAKPIAEKVLAAMKDDPSGDWAADFWELRRQFALAPSAQSCLATYDKIREKQADAADKLFNAARNEKDDGARQAKYKELLAKYPASKWIPLVQRWVAQ
ncbi:MAG: hypothetical protein RL885_15805 [Planctomycetota bacterium]